MRTIMWACWMTAAFALSGCGREGAPASTTPKQGDTPAAAAAAPNPAPAATPAPAQAPATTTGTAGAAGAPLSCADEIGADAAAARAATCRSVSPATHPPCNAANSCAMIDDEIARSCALLGRDGPATAGCGPAADSPQAAADVVRRYYAAINARDYATAWQQWGEDGRPGQSYAAFKAGFAQTRAVKATIGALGASDGAAGSVYQPVPVTVEATLADGTRQRFRGDYVLRRVNGVDGASAAQLRWRIDSAKLQDVPVQ
ncbi:hypothetical protein NB699_003732 [Xanthomonas sacchari]|uniref:Lipoprotein n=1 Tax=Xanthomonas sacchari TaxID=56458 RepID=A0AA46Q5S1_9XANT|nr:hypothetical protein [Xanthomonas sacchari]MCW0368749.1 hypothetical protein [Xanthomonas sacchari]MCW0442795.1 hypothetical protein [Xanthomonas sacchari]UYK87551.1 hypothetical protein NG824_13750 [Xanthomonas sacchari]